MLTDQQRHISHGFYRVSDAEAGRLARAVGKHLPKPGMELRVQLPDGRLAWLQRTPMAGGGPRRRGWVWAIWGLTR